MQSLSLAAVTVPRWASRGTATAVPARHAVAQLLMAGIRASAGLHRCDRPTIVASGIKRSNLTSHFIAQSRDFCYLTATVYKYRCASPHCSMAQASPTFQSRLHHLGCRRLPPQWSTAQRVLLRGRHQMMSQSQWAASSRFGGSPIQARRRT